MSAQRKPIEALLLIAVALIYVCSMLFLCGWHAWKAALLFAERSSTTATLNKKPMIFRQLNEGFTNGSIEIAGISAEAYRELGQNAAPEHFVYVTVIYSYKNISQNELQIKKHLPSSHLEDADFKEYAIDDEATEYYIKAKGLRRHLPEDTLPSSVTRFCAEVFLVPENVCNEQYLYLTFDGLQDEIELDIHIH